MTNTLKKKKFLMLLALLAMTVQGAVAARW